MPKLNFTVDSALLSELGERLVESVNVALLELVKNAYDADASKVVIAMIPGDDGYEINVADNGNGMTLEQVKNYWMRIATTNKLSESTSPVYGRQKSGSKGIGRFSCRRLGTKLALETTARLKDDRYEKTSFEIDWATYKPGTDVTRINCEGRTTHSTKGKSGTRLVITGGHSDEWTQRGWGVLKRRLILLVSNQGAKRKGFSRDPGFNASLVAPDFEESDVVDPREQLMDAGWGRLSLSIDKNGKAVYSLLAKQIGKKQLTLPEKYPELAGVTADIAILPDRKDQFRNGKVIAISQLREALGEWGGIRVRAEGIQVPPYGEPQNDWLNIDRDRGVRKGSTAYSPVKQLAAKLQGVTAGRELLNMLSSRSYLGEVNVPNTSDPSGLFVMKASREGFVGDQGISLLSIIIRVGVDWSTVYRDYYLRLKDEEVAKHSREVFEEVIESPVHTEEVIEQATAYVQEEIKHITASLPSEERTKVVQNITKATEAIVKSNQSHRDELRHLRLVASTSSLLLIFSHEVKSLLGLLDDVGSNLSHVKNMLPENKMGQAQAMLERMEFTKHRFTQLLDMTSLLAIDSKDSSSTRLALRTRAEKAKSCFGLILDKYGIDIDLDSIPNALKVGPMLEAELYAILLNAFSNAIKSTIAKNGPKLISVHAEKISRGAKINISDTGLGVPKQWGDLFLPFVADPSGDFYQKLKKRLNPEDEHVVGTGSGLGLSIIKEIIESHQGTICFAQPSKGTSCNLEIVLP